MMKNRPRGPDSDGISPSIFSSAARRSLLLLFVSFFLRSPTPPPFKSRTREAALFLELVLLLLFGSTCRHHHGVFVPRMPRATLTTRRLMTLRKKNTRESRIKIYQLRINRSILAIDIASEICREFSHGTPFPGGSSTGMPLIFFVSGSHVITQSRWSAVLLNSGPLCSQCNPFARARST
ncbi:hypothetical protein PUN28_015705 [Cardiocondyla obscurior]|uniref:Uncharacterized protein n=1 Tax=Cardiocondyla obscurior TaxID=286306 RepID=A0AAW2EZL2_9HYME